MNFDFLKDQRYIDARNNDDFFFFGKVDVPTPSWQEILEELNRQYKIHLHNRDFEIFKYQDNLGFILHKCEHIPVVKEFLIAISLSHHRIHQLFTSLGYISLSSESKTYGRHKDEMDVWCWQMQGKTLWTVEGKNEKFEKILEPGELIYVPRDMWHNTKPITPRAGLSFGSENVKYKYPTISKI